MAGHSIKRLKTTATPSQYNPKRSARTPRLTIAPTLPKGKTEQGEGYHLIFRQQAGIL